MLAKEVESGFLRASAIEALKAVSRSTHFLRDRDAYAGSRGPKGRSPSYGSNRRDATVRADIRRRSVLTAVMSPTDPLHRPAYAGSRPSTPKPVA